MKFDNKTFQQKYEAWKNGADYWKDIRGINLGGDSQAEEPSEEEILESGRKINAILNQYNVGKDVFTYDIAKEMKDPIPQFKGGKDDYVNEFVNRMAPLVGQQLSRYGYNNDAAFYNVMRQLAWESNYGRSRVAREQHNYGGVGWNGKTYTTYKDDKDFVEKYMRLMHNRYSAALKADSTQGYAKALKDKRYFEDSLDHYTNGLLGMKSVVKASLIHRKNHKGDYNYNVKLTDLIDDYEDAKAQSPIMLNSLSTKNPSTIRADVPTTLLGPSAEEIKAQQYKDLQQKTFDYITQPTPLPPAMQNMLQGNNKGKDAYGQKFWQRRGANLHFKGGKDKQSFADWSQKAKLKFGLNIDNDPTYNYRLWYNKDPQNAYKWLNNDPGAHFGDDGKTIFHPTRSDESSVFGDPYGAPSGHWGEFDGRSSFMESPFQEPSREGRFWYLNMAEDNGAVPFDSLGRLWRMDGDLYGGVLPAVQVIGKKGVKK